MTDSHNADCKRNLHAPWRMEYIRLLGDPEPGCFLCRARDEDGREEPNLLLWRTPRCLVLLNRFPYTGGHLLIAPREHLGQLEQIEADALAEMMSLAADATNLLTQVVHAEGYNIGINVGRCAGAGLPGHLHLHVVPRWSGDTNFMAVLGDVRVIPQSLAELRRELLKAGAAARLPRVLYG